MLSLPSCEPPIWARSGHAQTILGHILPSPTLERKGRRVLIDLEDGDQLVVFVQEGPRKDVVYIFHGLAGSTDSTYMHRTSIIAQELGCKVVMVNHRGCGEGAGLAKGPYHSGRGEDLSAVLAWGRQAFPDCRHHAIGFSMSGNALLLLLSGVRGETKPDTGISVNAPIHLADSSRLLRTGLNRIYDTKFYVQCRRDILRAKAKNELPYPLPRLTTLRRLDDLYTAPAGGFKNRDDYYESCSTHLSLDRIQTPTIILTAKDDPFVPVQNYVSAAKSSSVHLHIEEKGGHMGYLTRARAGLGYRRWQDLALRRSLEFQLR